MWSACIIPLRLGNVWAVVKPKYPNHQIPQCCHYARSRFCAYLTEVLLKRDIPHIVKSVFDAPLPPIQLQQSFRRRFLRGQTGNAISRFASLIFTPKICCDAVDTHDLLMEREVDVAFEVRAAANLSGFDTSMPFIYCFMLRGEKPPIGGIRYRFSMFVGCP